MFGYEVELRNVTEKGHKLYTHVLIFRNNLSTYTYLSLNIERRHISPNPLVFKKTSSTNAAILRVLCTKNLDILYLEYTLVLEYESLNF